MSQPLSLENVAKVVEDLQGQLSQAREQIASQQNALEEAASSYQTLKLEVNKKSNHLVKPNKPESYSGKSSIRSWAIHMDNYLKNCANEEAVSVASSYLIGPAHEWWIVHQTTNTGSTIDSWEKLKDALIARFETLNKEKLARDKLATWKQIKDVITFNEDFQRIILDISDISESEKIDRYSRGLKSYIWKELCTKDYDDLTVLMRDAQRVESAHKRLGGSYLKSYNSPSAEKQNDPMEIGNIEIKKLTPEEREECFKKGLCLRCRQPGHIAKNCPKGKRD